MISDDGEKAEKDDSARNNISTPSPATPPGAAVSPRAPATPGRGMLNALVQTTLRMTRLEARAATLVGMLLENDIEVAEELLLTANI